MALNSQVKFIQDNHTTIHSPRELSKKQRPKGGCSDFSEKGKQERSPGQAGGGQERGQKRPGRRVDGGSNEKDVLIWMAFHGQVERWYKGNSMNTSMASTKTPSISEYIA